MSPPLFFLVRKLKQRYTTQPAQESIKALIQAKILGISIWGININIAVSMCQAFAVTNVCIYYFIFTATPAWKQGNRGSERPC